MSYIITWPELSLLVPVSVQILLSKNIWINPNAKEEVKAVKFKTQMEQCTGKVTKSVINWEGNKRWVLTWVMKFLWRGWWDISFLPKSQPFSMQALGLWRETSKHGRDAPPPWQLGCFQQWWPPYLPCFYSPVHHLLPSFLTVTSRSFHCSNKAITCGLERECPAYKNVEKK